MVAVPTVPAPTPAVAQVHLTLAGPRASPGLAFVGSRIELRGAVRPFVAGQSVLVRLGAAGRMRQERVAITRSAGGGGGFAVRLPTDRTGSVSMDVSHAATSAMGAFSVAGPRLRVLSAEMGQGARGPGVWFLQRRLSHLHFAVPLSGIYEAGTENAVIAYRKLLGLTRISSTGAGVISDLQRGAGAFWVRFARDGKHVEANLAKQVLAEIEPHGRVYKIYPISSGKPSTPTVLGRFQVYLKTAGVNSEGMVDSNYFIRGYAIHGYPEVPTWAASHGCLRVPIEDAPAIFGWVQVGTIVDVYY